MNRKNIQELQELIRKLYGLVLEMHTKFPHWKFTPDGRLVGDIGEALACYYFGLTPLDGNKKTHDAKTDSGCLVQIKTTQRNIVGLGLKKRDFEHLIALKINSDGKADVIYNGSGNRVWKELKNTNNTSISVQKLKSLNKEVPETERLKRINE